MRKSLLAVIFGLLLTVAAVKLLSSKKDVKPAPVTGREAGTRIERNTESAAEPVSYVSHETQYSQVTSPEQVSGVAATRHKQAKRSDAVQSEISPESKPLANEPKNKPTLRQREERIHQLLRKRGGKGLNTEEMEVIVTALRDDAYMMRATAASALGRTKSAEAVEPLVDALLDGNLEVRKRALASLSKLSGVHFNYKPNASRKQRQRMAEIIRTEYMELVKERLR